jgi:hypothetical protein
MPVKILLLALAGLVLPNTQLAEAQNIAIEHRYAEGKLDRPIVMWAKGLMLSRQI